MLEYIFDITNFYTLYPIYASVLLGLSLRLLIYWSFKVEKLELITNKIEFKLTINCLQMQKKSRIGASHFLIWIIRFIRNKAGTGDDTEASMISLYS